MTRVAVAAVAAALLGCQWNPVVLEEPPPPFRDTGEPSAELELGKTRRDQLDCPTEGRCQDRFRLQVPEAGQLHVRVIPLGARGDIEMRAVLEGPTGVLAQRSAEAGTVDLEVPVGAGPHYVLLQALGGHFDYEVTATFRAESGVQAAQPRIPTAPSLTPGREERKPPTLRPGSNYDPTAITQFPKWRMYAFADPPEKRLDSGEKVAFPAAEQQVLRAIRYELADRGYFPSEDPGEVQFLVSAHVGSRTETYYMVQGVVYAEDYDQWFQKWGVRGGTITPQTYTDGTLVIDFIDPATGLLLWHGWTTVPLKADQDMRETIRKGVREILTLFPPR